MNRVEKLLKQLIQDFGSFRENIQTDINQLKEIAIDSNRRICNLEADVEVLKSDVADMKPRIQKLEAYVEVLKSDVADMKPRIQKLEADVEVLKSDVKDLHAIAEGMQPRMDESRTWIRTMLERQEVHNAETDNLKFKVSTVEGALKGVADSLEPIRIAR